MDPRPSARRAHGMRTRARIREKVRLRGAPRPFCNGSESLADSRRKGQKTHTKRTPRRGKKWCGGSPRPDSPDGMVPTGGGLFSAQYGMRSRHSPSRPCPHQSSASSLPDFLIALMAIGRNRGIGSWQPWHSLAGSGVQTPGQEQRCRTRSPSLSHEPSAGPESFIPHPPESPPARHPWRP